MKRLALIITRNSPYLVPSWINAFFQRIDAIFAQTHYKLKTTALSYTW